MNTYEKINTTDYPIIPDDAEVLKHTTTCNHCNNTLTVEYFDFEKNDILEWAKNWVCEKCFYDLKL